MGVAAQLWISRLCCPWDVTAQSVEFLDVQVTTAKSRALR